jgi:hypothetical protein
MYRLGRPSAIENIFACTHTCFFAPASLEGLLRQSGYSLVAREHFRYDTNRPGQKVSATEKLAISLIESTGRVFGYRGFRMIYYATPASIDPDRQIAQ